MRIHSDTTMGLDEVRIEDRGVATVCGSLSALRWEDDGSDDDVDLYVHPEQVEWVIATFSPASDSSRGRCNERPQP